MHRQSPINAGIGGNPPATLMQAKESEQRHYYLRLQYKIMTSARPTCSTCQASIGGLADLRRRKA